MAVNFRIEVDIDNEFKETTVKISNLKKITVMYGEVDDVRARGGDLPGALRNLANLLILLRDDAIEIIGMESRGLLRDLEPEEDGDGNAE